MTIEALDTVRAIGRRPGAVLGAGMEGVVVALEDDAAVVAKVWHGRTASDVARLQVFHAAVATAGLPFATPVIHELVEADGRVVTLEARLPGAPLAGVDHDADEPVPDLTLESLVDVLVGLARTPVVPGMEVLPALSGEPPLTPGPSAPFGASLAALVARRVARSVTVLGGRLPDVGSLTAAVVERLEGLAPVEPRLLHGDLIAPNVMVEGGRVVAVLDFGFLTAVGDPAFDAAVTASIVDMYSPRAREHEQRLDAAIAVRLPYPPERLALYRAGYALATATCFSSTGADGHFEWCARVLERDDVRDVLGSR